MTRPGPTPPTEPPLAVPGLGRQVVLARLALLWEAVWRQHWPVASGLALYLGISLFDLWRLGPLSVHWLALLGLLLFCAFVLFNGRGSFVLASRAAILARLERDNGLAHQPLRALEDQPALGLQTPEGQLLWRRHLARLRTAIPLLKPVLPRPLAIRQDRYGLRLLAGIFLLAGFVAAGPEWQARLLAGFMPASLDPAGADFRLDAWITPPAYTGAAPVMLAGAAVSGAVSASGAPIRVPVGSELSLRLFGAREVEIYLMPPSGERQRLPVTRIDTANSHANARLERSQRVQIRQSAAKNLEWQIEAIPDNPPIVSLLEKITVTRQYGMRLNYGVSDDYGVLAAGAEITLMQESGPASDPPLKVAFPAPQKAAKKGQIAFMDLTSHAWAGRKVQIRLTAEDAAGQTGRSPPIDLILPQRPFEDPLAKALIEQRGKLASGPEANGPENDKQAIHALDALSLHPEKFFPEIKPYLALRVIRHRLSHAQDRQDLRDEVSGLLWALALQMDEGDQSLAGSELSALQKALMQALSDGASDEEIAALTQALREALDRYLEAMREQEMEDGPRPPAGADEKNSGMIDKSDLDAMISQIERLSKSGARGAAQEMLSKLQNILENMRPNGTTGQQSASQKKYGEALQELSQMMRRQQQLQDQTQQQRQQGPTPGDGGLARAQENLRGALEALRGKMDKAAPSEAAPNTLGRAEGAMRDAVRALREGKSGDAVAQQGQALDQLRAGADALARMLREEDAKAQKKSGDGDDAASDQQTDPLGRPIASDSGSSTAIPEQFDIERALQIRRELELRASQRRRPLEELKYIDRLLQQF